MELIDRFWRYFSYDIGIDLGTANTLVLVLGKGIVVREPSVVAMHKKTKRVLAIGTEAKRMIGKTPPTIVAMRPLKDGVISDFDATAAMLTHYIHEIHKTPSGALIPKIPKPKVVVGIPSGVTEVERRAVWEVALSAGAREAFLIEEPMAAAIGVGLPIVDPSGNMIVDVGGGTTEMAVISLGGIVVSRSIRVAGDEMDEAIIRFMHTKYNLLIGDATAEDLKINIGSAYLPRKSENKEKLAVVRGRDIESGLPRSLKVSETEIREALSPVISEIVEEVGETIEETPPELVADIYERGIVLCGGGAQLRGIDKTISHGTEIPVRIADDPTTCTIRGINFLLDDEKLMRRVLLPSANEEKTVR